MSLSLWLSDEILPVRFTPERTLSDVEFQQFCFRNDQVQIERTAEGTICLYPLNSAAHSQANVVIAGALREWWHSHEAGRTAGSTAGFFLRDGSMLCPEAAYISRQKMHTVNPAEWSGIPHICPDFVIEILARWENRKSLERKITTWLENGTTLAWLIDPYRGVGDIHVPHTEPTRVCEPVMRGSGFMDGFCLDLSEIWRCYGPEPTDR